MSEPRSPETPQGDIQTGDAEPAAQDIAATHTPEEIGGRGGLDPTRYGDWEKNGRCVDF
jgi:hypothetical protein